MVRQKTGVADGDSSPGRHLPGNPSAAAAYAPSAVSLAPDAVPGGERTTVVKSPAGARHHRSRRPSLLDKVLGVDVDDNAEEITQGSTTSKPGMKLDVQITCGGCCGVHPTTGKQFWFYHPEGSFRKIWDLIQSVLLIYIAIAVPIRIGFDVDNPVLSFAWFSELMIDVYFWADIVLNFRTGVYNKDGIVIYDFKKIRSSYICGWFVIDVVSCFPASYIAEIISANSGQGLGGTKGVKMLRLLRLAKMLRLGRLKRILERYSEELQPYVKIVKLSGMLLVAAFMAHLLAATWFFFGQGTYILPDGSTQWGWVHKMWGPPNDTVPESTFRVDFEEGHIGEMVPLPWAPERSVEDPRWSTLNSEERLGVSLADAYLASYYWAVTTLTTIGYGDITPSTQAEMMLAIIAEAFGGFLFGMLVGSLSSHITAGNVADQEYNRQMESVREFLRQREVPLKQRRKVMAFYQNYLKRQTVFDQKDLLGRLPDTIAIPLMKEMYRKVIEPVAFLARLEDETLSAVCLLMQPMSVLPNDYICKGTESYNNDFYIIQSGRVEVWQEDTAEPIMIMVPGEFFGEEGILGLGGESEGGRVSHLAHSSSSVELVFISRAAFVEATTMHPELAQSLAKFVYERHSGTTDANAGSTDGESAIEKQKIYNARLTKRDLEVLHQIAYGVTKKNKQRHTSVAELMDLDDEEARQMEAISSQIDSSTQSLTEMHSPPPGGPATLASLPRNRPRATVLSKMHAKSHLDQPLVHAPSSPSFSERDAGNTVAFAELGLAVDGVVTQQKILATQQDQVLAAISKLTTLMEAQGARLERVEAAAAAAGGARGKALP